MCGCSVSVISIAGTGVVGPGEPHHLLGKYARQHVLLCGELHRTSKDELLGVLSPKHHVLLHCAESTTTNPRLEWNYSDEDTIGNAVEIASGCNIVHLPVKLLERYRCNVQLPLV